MNNNLAPIVLFVYNRLDHTKQTIEALQRNELASQSDLIIFSDAAKHEKDIETVDRLRSYISKLDGFKNIELIKRENNFGLAKNIIEGVTEVLEQHRKVIALEDDLLTSKNFLTYMNQALNFYENNKRVFSISGYTGNLQSLSDLQNDVYFSYRPSSWGWGTWKDQWDDIDWEIVDFNDFIQNKKKVKEFNRGGIDMARMLKHCMEGKNHSWAIRWSYAMYKQDKLCVYPKVSKIQNVGFGDNATNCKGIDIYQTNLDITSNSTFAFAENIELNQQIIKEFKYQFSYTNKLIKRINKYTFQVFK